MKKIYQSIIAVLLLSQLFSCSEKFEVAAPYKSVTVVYGLLGISDSAHYIKITKGFFDKVNNNLLAAKNVDSLYFDTLQVKIEELNSNGGLVNTFPLSKVNLKTEGYIVDSGTFVHDPAYAYKFKANLNANYTYKLTVSNPKTGDVITGITPIISDNAADFNAQNFTSLDPLDFSDPAVYSTYTWNAPNNTAVMEAYYRFRYYEESFVGGVNVRSPDLYVDLPLIQNKVVTSINSQQALNYNYSNASFYSSLNGLMPQKALNVKRFIDTGDVVFYAGGVELKKYIDITGAQGGITADQIKPNYTNLVGSNVYGLYSTRVTHVINNVALNNATDLMLLGGTLTPNINFAGMSDH